MQKKKVCFICPWMNNGGGLQRVVSNLANIFSEDYDVSICIISKYDEKPFYPLNDSIKLDYLKNAIQNKTNIFIRLVAKICNYIEIPFSYIVKNIYYPHNRVNVLEKYLIEHSFDYVIASCGDLSMLLSCVNKEKVNSLLVGWQHNSFKDYFCTRGKYYYGRKKFAVSSYKKLDSLICLTERDSNVYKEQYGINSRNVYNPLSFKTDRVADLSKKNILFVGRLSWDQKGLQYLSEIIDKFYSLLDNCEWTFTIVGDGEDRKRLENTFKGKKYIDKIIFTGQQSNVEEYLLDSSILLNTSKWEGFGLVITEAMACSLPVIAFENDGPSEIIVNNFNGYLVPKYDTDLFVNYLLKLVNSEPLRNMMGSNSLKRSAFFSPETIYDNWLEVLSD